MSIGRQTLSEMRCSTPGCTEDHGPLWFHSHCHPEAPLTAFYENGEIEFRCAACEKFIVRVRVGV
jgi:hypothetical protein